MELIIFLALMSAAYVGIHWFVLVHHASHWEVAALMAVIFLVGAIIDWRNIRFNLIYRRRLKRNPEWRRQEEAINAEYAIRDAAAREIEQRRNRDGLKSLGGFVLVAIVISVLAIVASAFYQTARY
jgi:predicted alpha/beta-hydrolase family hydrolase